MNKYLILFFLQSLLGIAVSFGQEKVDYIEIEKSIKDQSSDLYYPKLLNQFEEGDTSMSTEQKRHCYYGYVFTENYSPYKRPKGRDQVDSLLMKSSHVDTLLVQHILDSTLAKFPFDLEAIVCRIRYSKSQEEVHLLKGRINIILDAISSTGNGQTAKTAFQIILLPHEILVLDHLKLVGNGKQTLAKNDIDIIGIAKNDSKIKKVYFDVSSMKPSDDPKNILFHQFYHVYMNKYKSHFEIE